MKNPFPSLLNLSSKDDVDYSALLDAISKRVEELIDQQPDLLFSYMYRLDVEEHKIKGAIEGKNNISLSENLARLILDRQLERLETRKKFDNASKP